MRPKNSNPMNKNTGKQRHVANQSTNSLTSKTTNLQDPEVKFLHLFHFSGSMKERQKQAAIGGFRERKGGK